MNKTELEAALTWLRTFNNNHSNTILARLLELEVENQNATQMARIFFTAF